MYPHAFSKAVVFAAALMLASAAPRAAFAAAPLNPAYTRSTHHYDVPAASVVVMDGHKTTLPAVLNHAGPVLVNFVFTTCATICPVLSGTFAKLQTALAAEAPNLRLVSISIDPEHDTPVRLTAYAKRHKAGPNWYFLTGELTEILAIQRAFDAYRGDKMNHASLTLMRASAKSPWVRIEGLAGAGDLIREFHGIKGAE
ncbi:SCO family protein [Methylomagnum sp.]